MWNDLSRSRQIIFVFVLCCLVSVNIYVFQSNISTLNDARARPLSRLSIDSMNPFPPFGLVAYPTVTALDLDAVVASISCRTLPIER